MRLIELKAADVNIRNIVERERDEKKKRQWLEWRRYGQRKIEQIERRLLK